VDGSEVAEIGVFVDKGKIRIREAIHGENGQPIVVCFEAGAGLCSLEDMDDLEAPPTYEVSNYTNATRVDGGLFPHNPFRTVSTMLLRFHLRNFFQTLTLRS